MSVWSFFRRHVAIIIFGAAILLALFESALQVRDGRFVRRLALQVVREARASTPREQVIALRDYIRAHVTHEGVPLDGRPFLRASARETLLSGKGYCGEVTRTFICMAGALGMRAQRINLWGKAPHVVAEVELAPKERVVVDCQNPPAIPDLEPLDKVILRPEYDDYYTLNLRRLRIAWIFSRVKMQMGPLTYWTENPHALKAALWFFLAWLIAMGHIARILLRYLLHRRGWVHVTEARALAEAGALNHSHSEPAGQKPTQVQHATPHNSRFSLASNRPKRP